MEDFFHAWISYKGDHASQLANYDSYRNLMTDFQKAFIQKHKL